MINLYIAGNENFSNNGDATLQPISAMVHKVINGMWMLEVELPYDEEGRYRKVDDGGMLRVSDPSVREISNTQIWRIYNYKRNTKSLSVVAFPRAMESNFDAPISQLILSSDVTGASAASSLSAVSEKYSVTSNITRTGRSEWNNTNLTRAINGTDDNSFVNVWGGEVVYDNLTIKILDGIGSSEEVIDVMYGKNINEISYEVDDSGLITRVYPLSTDGIRYWVDDKEYIDSPLISDYPIVHSGYLTTPYKLVEDDVNSISRTAQKTADIKNRIKTKASQLSHSIWNTAVSNGWKVDYLASIYKDIIANIQTMVTTDIAHADFVKAVNSAVSEGMAWMGDEEEPEWTWYEDQTDAWKYGSSESGHWARNEWQYVDKKWRWFGDDYYWQQPKDDDSEWTWYESKTTHKKWYGTQDRYYLKGQYIYVTEDGELKKFWLDGDGWYDSDKTDTSDWDWHESSSAAGAWWFGDEDGDNYMSGQWAFIDGTLYWFDDEGYYYGVKEEHPPFDWMQSGEAFWFGNPDHTTRSYWLKSQWAKIDRVWYRFDSDGYTEDIYSQALSMFHSGMSELTTLVQTCRSECYALLYDLMEEWTEEQFANGIDTPTVTINVDMIDLSKTVDYAQYQNLETIHLGDTVRCVDYVHQIATIERVVELTYDLLRGYNTAVTIGVANSTVGSMISGSTGGGSGSYNNAINVDFIEQAIAQKQAELVAGKNITLTDNLDGTQTIASDKLIRAGEHVTVVHNADGSDTISSEGGALDYWVETEHSISRYIENAVPDDWTCDEDYIFTEIVEPQLGDRTYKKPSTYRTINGICKCFVNNDWWWGCLFASDNEDAVKYQVYERGALQGTAPVQFSKTYGDVTMYFSGFYFLYPVSWYADWTDYDGVPYFGEFSGGYEDAYDGLLTAAGFRVADYHWTGMGIDQAFIFYGGTTESEPQTIAELPFRVAQSGEVHAKDFKINGESIFKVKDVQVDEGEGFVTVVSDKVAQIDLTGFQKSLVEGDNITLTPQQDGTVEVSATDTDEIAELTDVDIDSQTLANGQVLKYNSTTSKWENGQGGGGSANSTEISWSDYQALSQAEKENGTIYYIPDAPDSMAMPYLTMENGVPTLVFDDGE